MDDTSVTIKVHRNDDVYWWSMEFILHTSLGTSTFHIDSCEKLTLDQWRDLIAGNGLADYDFELERGENTFIYDLGDNYEVSTAKFEINQEYLIGPLTNAIDEAVERGIFGDEARDEIRTLNIKGSDE